MAVPFMELCIRETSQNGTVRDFARCNSDAPADLDWRRREPRQADPALVGRDAAGQYGVLWTAGRAVLALVFPISCERIDRNRELLD